MRAIYLQRLSHLLSFAYVNSPLTRVGIRSLHSPQNTTVQRFHCIYSVLASPIIRTVLLSRSSLVNQKSFRDTVTDEVQILLSLAIIANDVFFVFVF